MKLALKVVPGASCDAIAGWLDDSLKVRVTAPAESGKANKAVKKLLATTLGIAAADIDIVAGGASPRKIIEISSLSQDEVMARLKSA
jgi:uncharacterized protein (TIGR00251 family)